MRFPTRLGLAFGGAAAVALLADCSSGGFSLSPPARHQFVDATRPRAVRVDAPAHRGPNWISRQVEVQADKDGLLFVAASNGYVTIFPKNNPTKPIGRISNGVDGPVGLGVDGVANLYVANGRNSTVTVYAPPYTGGPTRTYTKGVHCPNYVAVGADGWVYVSNSCFDAGQVVEYPPNSTTPAARINFGGHSTLAGPVGIDLDASNNLYVAYNQHLSGSHTGPGGVYTFAPHSLKRKGLGITVGFAGGISFDGDGNLLIEDQMAAAVDVFPPGARTPSQTIRNGFKEPSSLAFGALQHRLYVGDLIQQNVQDISYPAGKTVHTFGGVGYVYGVALSPAAPKS
jgi:hypothetical protein